jgi:hypothetical protein
MWPTSSMQLKRCLLYSFYMFSALALAHAVACSCIVLLALPLYCCNLLHRTL